MHLFLGLYKTKVHAENTSIQIESGFGWDKKVLGEGFIIIHRMT